MNTLQAIENLHRLRRKAGEHIDDDLIYVDYSAAVNTAIDALKKQTPMRPYRNIVRYPYQSDLEVVQCPMCKRRLRTNRMTKSGDAFCPDCGQAIDWEPEESRLQSDTLLTEEVRDANDK